MEHYYLGLENMKSQNAIYGEIVATKTFHSLGGAVVDYIYNNCLSC